MKALVILIKVIVKAPQKQFLCLFYFQSFRVRLHEICTFRFRWNQIQSGTDSPEWTIPLKEAASLLWYFYRDPLRSLTLLSFNVLSKKS